MARDLYDVSNPVTSCTIQNFTQLVLPIRVTATSLGAMCFTM